MPVCQVQSTFLELTQTLAFQVLFQMQHRFIYRRLMNLQHDINHTADATFSNLERQVTTYWGQYEVQVHTTMNDARGPSTDIFCLRLQHPLEGTAEEIIEGAEISVWIETAPGGSEFTDARAILRQPQ